MEFLSPERPGAFGTGAKKWLGSDVLLPWVRLYPAVEEGSAYPYCKWQVEVDYANSGRYGKKVLYAAELTAFLIDWEIDPERALEDYFNLTPPIRQAQPQPKVEPKALPILIEDQVELDF